MSVIRCKHCPNATQSTQDVARLLGWRFFDGTNQAGKPMSDVVCPKCSGYAPEPKPVEEQEPSWKLRCNTCDWRSDEDDELTDGEPLDGPNAVELGRAHRCDPWVEIQPAGRETWSGLRAFNRDGSWRDPEAGATAAGFQMVGAQ